MVISPVQFVRGLFCSSIFIYLFIFYIDDQEKLNLIARSSHSHLYLFLKIYKYDDKTKPTGISPNIYVIYKKLLQAFQKSISLVKEFFLVNPFIGHRCFWRNITTSFTTVTSRNTTLFWYFFSLYRQFVAAT